MRRLFGGPSPSPGIATQLTEAQAIDLAKGAAGDHWLRDALNVALAQRNEAGVVLWTVETGGVGASLRIVIDDATGAILDRVAREGR
ncbi:MAG: PepSY domain-containing protein [Pseudomonadota bacterium]